MNTATVKRYRINKGRMIGSTILIIVLVTLSAITFSSAMSGAISHIANLSDKLATESYTTVQVVYGDTIWDLAAEYCSGNVSVNSFVKEICAMNNLKSETIYPGQEIKIPV